MINANEYGFLPSASAKENSAALQRAVNMGGVINVDMPGVYNLCEQITIGDDTTINFAQGVLLCRNKSNSGKNENAFINKGAFTGQHNKNITINGLHIDCNGVESDDFGVNSRIVGLRAQIGFIYVENLKIIDFECTGLGVKDYAIQISAFKNIYLENLCVIGNKDGVHLGWGDGFVIKNGKFCTFDDPIALNAFDYSTSNTHVGWIENGVIENCCDLDADSTVGYFCRILGGAWCRWYKGMRVQHSDTVAANGHTYRVVMNPQDGKLYTSNTAPCHSSGVAEYDGISWVAVRDSEELDCGCRNIVIKDCRLQKRRSIGVSISLNYDTYARSHYPGCAPVPHSNITLQNVTVENNIDTLLHSNYPTENVTLKNIDFGTSRLRFEVTDKTDEIIYPTVEIKCENVKLYDNTVCNNPRHPIAITKISSQNG